MSEAEQEYDAGGNKLYAGTVLRKLHDASHAIWRKRSFDDRIIFSDDFEAATLSPAWALSGTGSGYAGTRDTTKVANGLASMKLVTRSSSAAIDDVVAATVTGAILGGKKVRLKARFTLESLSLNKYATFTVTWFDSATKHVAGIRYDVANAVWQQLDATNAWVNITGGTQALAAAVFHWFEIEINFATNKYMRFLANEIHKALNLDIYQVADSTKSQLAAALGTTTATAAQATSFVDDVQLREIGD